MEQIEISQHLHDRSALLEKEKTYRHDHAFKQRMSPAAHSAAQILSNIRKTELGSFWRASKASKASKCAESNRNLKGVMYPGMSFALSRGHMAQTAMWKILAAMPKGCLLHAHMEAMIDIDWMIELAMEIPGYYLSAPGALSQDESYWSQAYQFQYRPRAVVQSQPGVNIWESGYTANQLVSVADAASTFPGGVSAFKAWAISRMTINEDEALQHHHGVDDIWVKFRSCFGMIIGLFYSEPIFRRCIPRLLQQLHEDGIKYVELRFAPLPPFVRTDSDEPDPDHMYFMECFQQELNAYLASPQGSGFWGARLIWTAIRAFPEEVIKNTMLECLKCKAAYPHLISGFDFVGQEDLGAPLIDLLPLAKWFQRQCAENNLNIPFFLHAGECLGDGDSTDSNIVDAILLKSRRIGHGFSLYKHPLLIDMIKEKQILVEMCPISHEVLRLTANILTHPMPALQARGVAVSLNNDDPAILGHGKNGLSHDFYQVLVAFENTGLAGLGTMVEDSVRWAAFEDESDTEWIKGLNGGGSAVKVDRLKEWREAFEAWCEWIVKEFGAYSS